MGRTSVMPVGTVTAGRALTMADGVGIAADIIGTMSSHDRPVLLLHGLSQQRAFWSPVVRRLRHRPVIVLDQRGHGVSDASAAADFTIPRVAEDVVEVLDLLGIEAVHLVGHSWGAAVAIAAAAGYPERILSVALIDGGLWVRDPLADREAELARLRPPELGLAPDDLWSLVASGSLAPWWSDETRTALEPTFVEDEHGLMRTRIGVDRHMAVLRALLDYDPWPDAARITAPAWHARCLAAMDARTVEVDDALVRARVRTAAETSILMQEWEGALHDVPLQWPALVAGFIDALIESAERKEA